MKLKHLILFLAVVLAACSTRHPVETRPGTSLPNNMVCQQLQAIDSLMWQQPDSALMVLVDFAASPKADSLSAFDGHYFQILLSELLFKNDYEQTNRVLLTANYTINEGRRTNSVISLMYEGGEVGFVGGYQFTRYSYIFAANVNNDALAPGNLIRIPGSRAELDEWAFADNGTFTDESGVKQPYTADMQRDDFWQFINQDSYLKNHKGEYAERGGAKMPWHHQVNFKFEQNIFFTQKNGRKHTLTVGCDVTNLANVFSPKWGAYKEITTNTLLNYAKGQYTYNLVNGARHLTTSQNYVNTLSAYQSMFNVRYTF